MVGGSLASFLFVVVVVVAVVVVPLLLDAYLCLEETLESRAAVLVICGAGRLPCLVMKSCIWLAILVVMVGCGGSGINEWVSCRVMICPVATANVASVRVSVLPNCSSCSSGV